MKLWTIVAIALTLAGVGLLEPAKPTVQERAEQGNAKAQVELGHMYTKGDGVPPNYAAAVKWYRKAAEQGYAKAQYKLLVMYSNGEGVPADDAEAVKWYRKAAEQGIANAQYNLGVMYVKGDGVRQDFVEAYAWFFVAAANGHEVAAKSRRDQVKASLTPEQLRRGEQRATELSEKYPAKSSE